jgi:hypothetical protein
VSARAHACVAACLAVSAQHNTTVAVSLPLSLLLRTRARVRAQSYTFLDWLQVFLPCFKWLRSYRIKEYLLVSITQPQSSY